MSELLLTGNSEPKTNIRWIQNEKFKTVQLIVGSEKLIDDRARMIDVTSLSWLMSWLFVLYFKLPKNNQMLIMVLYEGL